MNNSSILVNPSQSLPSLAACALHEEILNERADKTYPSTLTHENRAYKLCGCVGGGILVENSSPDSCPWSPIFTHCTRHVIEPQADWVALGISFSFISLAFFALEHGHIYNDENDIHTVWSGFIRKWTLNKNSDLMRWVAWLQLSLNLMLTKGLLAWHSYHVLILRFKLAFPLNAIADSSIHHLGLSRLA